MALVTDINAIASPKAVWTQLMHLFATMWSDKDHWMKKVPQHYKGDLDKKGRFAQQLLYRGRYVYIAHKPLKTSDTERLASHLQKD